MIRSLGNKPQSLVEYRQGGLGLPGNENVGASIDMSILAMIANVAVTLLGSVGTRACVDPSSDLSHQRPLA